MLPKSQLIQAVSRAVSRGTPASSVLPDVTPPLKVVVEPPPKKLTNYSLALSTPNSAITSSCSIAGKKSYKNSWHCLDPDEDLMFGSICLHGSHWILGEGGGIGFTPLSQVLYRFKFKGKKLGSINKCIQGNKGFI